MTSPSPQRAQQIERQLPRLQPGERILFLEVVTLDHDQDDRALVHQLNVLTSAFVTRHCRDGWSGKDEKREPAAAADYWQRSRWRSAEGLSLLQSKDDGSGALERSLSTVCPLCQQDGQTGLFAAQARVKCAALAARTPLLFRYEAALDPASSCHYLCILFAQLPLAVQTAVCQPTLAAPLPQPQPCCAPACSLPGFFPLYVASCSAGCEPLPYCRQHLPVEHLHLESMLCFCCSQARRAWGRRWKRGGADDLPVQRRKAEVALALLATPLKPAECRRTAAGRRDIAMLQPLSCELKERIRELGERRALLELIQSCASRPHAAIEDEECLPLTDGAETAEAEAEAIEAMTEETAEREHKVAEPEKQEHMAAEEAEQEQEEKEEQGAPHSQPDSGWRKRRRVVLLSSSSSSRTRAAVAARCPSPVLASEQAEAEAEMEREAEDCGQRRRKRRATAAAAASAQSPRKTRSQSVRSLAAQRRRQQGQREAKRREEAGWQFYDPSLWETRPSQTQPQPKRSDRDEENLPPPAAPAAGKKTRRLGKPGPPLRPEQHVDAASAPPLPPHLRQSAAPTVPAPSPSPFSSPSYCTLLSESQWQTLRHPLARLSQAVVTARANTEAGNEGGGGEAVPDRPSPMLHPQAWKARCRPVAAQFAVRDKAGQRQSLAAARVVAQKVVHYQFNGRRDGRRA